MIVGYLEISVECPLGKGYNDTGAEPTCVTCDTGFYSDTADNQTCKACPQYHTTETSGAESMDDCYRK